MLEPFLLSRLQLCFDATDNPVTDDLSAVTLTPDGNLWLGSDEEIGLERLSPVATDTFARWQHYDLSRFFPFLERDAEIDIEGLDYADGYLWLVGSHSTKRKKAKGKDEARDLERLAEVVAESNRYLLARIPIADGEPVASFARGDSEPELTAAALQLTSTGNLLLEALASDPHFGKIVASGLPSKENGFDIEGLAVRGARLFLGLRGPVLRGMAAILEIEPTPSEAGVFQLAPLGPQGELYKKHFLGLEGLGVRDLCWRGEDLLVLAGPTLEADGPLKVFQFRGIMQLEGHSSSVGDSERLSLLFDLPVVAGADRAEGLALYPTAEGTEALMVVYDSPAPTRKPSPGRVVADLLRLH